jgi:1-acyl-sn-glycerol-3-phosphate acyltransferase
MVRTVRSYLFTGLMISWTAAICIFFTWALWRPRHRLLPFVHLYMNGIAALERWVLGLHYVVEGREHLPAGPCIVAAKHQAAWETLKLHLLLNDPAVVLKFELLRLPLWGRFAAKLDLIPIERKAGPRALIAMRRAAKDVVADGRSIVIFPQGTRVPPGEQERYKPGLLMLYDVLKLPVVPMAHNAGVFWDKGPGGKRGGTITVRFLPAIKPGLDRATFARELEYELETVSSALSVYVGGPATPVNPPPS